MISLYGLFILLLTAEAIHAQDNKNGVDQASGSKDATSLPQRANYLRLPTTLWGIKAHDQSGTDEFADHQSRKKRKGGYWLRKISKSCSQQQSQPEPQPSTLHDPPQSNKMPLPVCLGKLEEESYNRGRNTDQYNAFIKEKTGYFESEYSSKKKLGKGKSGVVFLATKKSDGKKVAYKPIPKSNIRNYALESTPPPRCHLSNPLVPSEKPSVEQCMLPRPLGLLFPYEFALQRYLSRPGYKNPYVPVVFDYYILEYEYIVVMEYFGGKWASLSRYADEKGKLDIEIARDIIKEIVTGMISLKQYGVFHKNIHDMFQ
ncbi:hypothetical protein BASA50_000216 [Batrachochytrium salamandrivorans]|uniref:non-specific serine/threonine protein kinase n=1 Tax=Batrachochytrium salamandrivorans TaxID=1357716 RepID=A0ABQ8EUH8_9FUNG|nr:hypothetical protein BASA62_008148 [Batrachochytrium salamandrivorans]KAH6578028.1 hypothetical protein BASA60_003801 [Batrachochytrium salamandrivorans]KAH6586852.1 hypothetical protein BASA50_000216 [Batrachochytrium salamandrivorans]KAH9274676.1 hypothetical protein BASA83_002862 [Batrachochytrium salamandrivorans]